MSTDIIQNELTSCLTEIEKVEKELDAQLQILGKEVDAGFSQMKELNKSFVNLATKVVKNQYDPRIAGGLLIAGVAISSFMGAYENVKAAKAHNKALDKLLVTKHRIATEKLKSTEKLSHVVDHVLERLKKLVDNEANGSYDMNSLDANIWQGKLSVMDKTMTIYRTSLYSKLLVDYLIAEYSAWLMGKQCSQIDRPTYFDCNVLIKDSLIHKEKIKKEIKYLFQNEDSCICGYDVYKVYDPQIFSTMLLEYGFGNESNTNIRQLPAPNDSFTGRAIQKNISYKMYKRSLRKQKVADFFGGGVITFILVVVFILLDYALFHWLNWAGWIEWVLGILLGVIGCGAIIACHDFFEEMHMSWKESIYMKAMDKQLDMAGYVEIYHPDLEKKNLVWAGTKGLFSGLATAIFD